MRTLDKITIFFFLILSLLACRKQNPLEKERKEFAKTLEGDIALTVYRGIKITIRSLSIDKNAKNIDSIYNDLQGGSLNGENTRKYTVHLLNLILGTGKQENSLTVKETIEIVKVFNQLKDELKDKDEDDYPTLVEVLLRLNNLDKGGSQTLIKELNWSNSKEHFVLSAGLMMAKPLPKSFQLYETSKSEIPKLENTEIKPLAAIFKGIIMLQNDWIYLSEEALTQGIESLNSGNLTFEFGGFPSIFEETKLESREEEVAQLHGISCLLRGYVRTKMDDEEKNDLAVADLEMFLEDADKIGADNELVWLTGAYVSIKKEDNKKAIGYIEKLEHSPGFTEKEKASFRETKEYLSDRKPDRALNAISDKVFIVKLTLGYISAYVLEIKWYDELTKSDTGKQLLRIPELIDSEYQKVEKDLSTDGIKEKGKKLLDSIL